MPPEKSAYALARYSRSPDSIEGSLRWVHGHSSEKFWDQFYFDYGHASIADLGHVIICFEHISELAAIRLEDEPLWDGQAKSSRYQNFGPSGCHVPDAILGSETEANYRGILNSLFSCYSLLHDPLKRFIADGGRLVLLGEGSMLAGLTTSLNDFLRLMGSGTSFVSAAIDCASTGNSMGHPPERFAWPDHR